MNVGNGRVMNIKGCVWFDFITSLIKPSWPSWTRCFIDINLLLLPLNDKHGTDSHTDIHKHSWLRKCLYLWPWSMRSASYTAFIPCLCFDSCLFLWGFLWPGRGGGRQRPILSNTITENKNHPQTHSFPSHLQLFCCEQHLAPLPAPKTTAKDLQTWSLNVITATEGETTFWLLWQSPV